MTPEEADKAYDEAPAIPISDEEIARMVAVATACKDGLAKQRDAWRAACRYLYEVIGEGGAKGRPMDLISKGDYGRIIAMIGKAESLEDQA